MGQSLVQENPTCHRTAKPCVQTTEASAPEQEKTPQWEAQAPVPGEEPLFSANREKPVQQWRPSTAKNKNKWILFKKYPQQLFLPLDHISNH